MLSEMISKLVKGLDSGVDENNLGDPDFDNSLYEVNSFAKENFHEITDRKNSRKIAFVDGGNQELIGAPNFSVQLNRINFNIFDGPKRLLQKILPNTLE